MPLFLLNAPENNYVSAVIQLLKVILSLNCLHMCGIVVGKMFKRFISILCRLPGEFVPHCVHSGGSGSPHECLSYPKGDAAGQASAAGGCSGCGENKSGDCLGTS